MIRGIDGIIKGRNTMDGAGVKLYRVFGGPDTVDLTDPFLLLDFFGSNKVEEYINGFPWHPHRGIETVTLLFEGKVEHQDSLGNKGTIYPGQVQWMTAGSGIFHQEMPKPLEGTEIPKYNQDPFLVRGLQLWINLPSYKKMTQPVYRDVKSIPKEKFDFGEVSVLAGEFAGIEGPVKVKSDVDPAYIHVKLNGDMKLKVKEGYTVLAYVVDGSAKFAPNSPEIGKGNLVIFTREGDEVKISGNASFIVLSGRPLNEPVAWYGPIVMNTEDQIIEAFEDLRKGTFIKHREVVFE
ncbi:Pirin [Saccharolobus shibatae B12]|uniref:Pirin n=1 Tax=Saccharolobus shibatae (strain ATCC 51178 / DSM 5389 / JCM 8931 / NBRC 15437 / B12) TaxID=523848 RepID=A0A8F5BPX2_SACSH|nr:pirin family protein [Saccharolobus shibatae]QXJ29156.1 Pirin [Saccharolobus shibatae B12]